VNSTICTGYPSPHCKHVQIALTKTDNGDANMNTATLLDNNPNKCITSNIVSPRKAKESAPRQNVNKTNTLRKYRGWNENFTQKT